MARIGGSKRGRPPSPLRRRNPAAQAVRSPKFRPKVFRDPRTYHRPTAKDAERGQRDDDDGEEDR